MAGASGKWETRVRFRTAECTPHIHTTILYDGHLYAQSYDYYHNELQNGLVCLDLDGNLKWRSGPDRVYGDGGLLIADKLIFVMDALTGELCLVEATPEKYMELARHKVLPAEDQRCWAQPALADGKLIVRDHKGVMRCLVVGKQP